jgi:hypothetical protein
VYVPAGFLIRRLRRMGEGGCSGVSRMAHTAASAELWQNLWNKLMHAAKTRPTDAAFMPTSMQRTCEERRNGGWAVCV